MFIYDEVIKILTEKNLLGESPLNPIDENYPKASDSLSELINKLSCSTTQMWHSQDIIYKMRFMKKEEFMKEYDGKLDEVHLYLKRACDLNVQRAHIMDAIDKKMLEIKRA